MQSKTNHTLNALKRNSENIPIVIVINVRKASVTGGFPF